MIICHDITFLSIIVDCVLLVNVHTLYSRVSQAVRVLARHLPKECACHMQGRNVHTC